MSLNSQLKSIQAPLATEQTQIFAGPNVTEAGPVSKTKGP